jgi:hypothetical protein
MKPNGQWRLWLLAMGLAAAIVGAKVHVAYQFGTDMPYMDQLAKEGEMILAPFYEGSLRIHDFFVPHSEHRIAPTLALNLFLAAVGGQWDARVQCVVNAFLHAGILLGIAVFAWHRFSVKSGLFMAWFLMILGDMPLAWQNILEGFQSQFYFLIGFSLIAIYGLLAARGVRQGRWWLGLGCAGLASVSMGSGFLCAFPVALVSVVRLLKHRKWRTADVFTLVVVVLIAAAGWHFRANAPWHAGLHPRNVGEFARYLFRCLAWPRSEWSWFALWVWLPWLAFAARTAFRRRIETNRDEIVVCFGLWALLQIIAVTYSRGVGGNIPASRYGDVFAIGVVANLLILFSRRGAGRRWHVLTAVWSSGVLVAGAISVLPVWRTDLPEIAGRYRECERNVAGYVRTGDARFLEKGEVPLPYRDWLRRILDRPAIRKILPASVRAPLPLVPDPAFTHGFVLGNGSPAMTPLNAREYWGSYGQAHPAAWRSRPIAPTSFHFWKFELAGSITTPNVGLWLDGPSGAPVSSKIRPPHGLGDSWRSAWVKIPDGVPTIGVHALTEDNADWLSFSAPVEVSTLSELVRRFTQEGVWVWAGGIVILIAITAVVLQPGGKRSTRTWI